MTNQSNQEVVVVSVLPAAVITLAAISSNEVKYVTYASKEILNCPKNNNVNQPTVQSASQVAIGNKHTTNNNPEWRSERDCWQ